MKIMFENLHQLNNYIEQIPEEEKPKYDYEITYKSYYELELKDKTYEKR